MKKILLIILILFSHFTFSKEYVLNGGIFDLNVHLIISKDTVNVKKTIESLTTVTNIDFDVRGLTIYNYGYPVIMWFSEKPSNDILNHELMHVTISLMDWAGIPLNETTEEVYAFTIQYLTKQIENVR